MLYSHNSYSLRKFRKHLHKISISVFFILLLSFFGCTKRKPILINEQEFATLKKQLPAIQFSKRAYTTQLITEKAHTFSSDIAFKEVRAYSSKKDTYTFVWIVDATYTKLEELQKWKIGMILKPKNKADFEDEDLEKKGIKTIGVLTTPYVLGDEICIVLRDFEFKPKEIIYIKYYLYSNTRKVNLDYWITKDLSLKL